MVQASPAMTGAWAMNASYAHDNISDQTASVLTQADPRGFTPPWVIRPRSHGMMQTSFDALRELSHLQVNWDSYGGAPPTRAAIALTKYLLTQIDGLFGQYLGYRIQPDLISPLADGGVQLEWSSHEDELDIQIGPAGTFGYLWTDESQAEPIYREGDNISWNGIIQVITAFILDSRSPYSSSGSRRRNSR